MSAAIGYERMNVISAGVRLEMQRRDSLRNYLAGSHERPKLTIVPDMYNNVNRLCNYGKGEFARPWQIKVPLQDENYHGFYLIENIHTGERKIVWRELLSCVY